MGAIQWCEGGLLLVARLDGDVGTVGLLVSWTRYKVRQSYRNIWQDQHEAEIQWWT